MTDAQNMMGVNDAANSLQLMLDGKLGNASLLAHNGMRVDNTQFDYVAKDVWEVEAVEATVAMYNDISAPFMAANGATSHELLRPVGAIKNGVNKVLNNIIRMIGDRDDANYALSPSLTFYFVR